MTVVARPFGWDGRFEDLDVDASEALLEGELVTRHVGAFGGYTQYLVNGVPVDVSTVRESKAVDFEPRLHPRDRWGRFRSGLATGLSNVLEDVFGASHPTTPHPLASPLPRAQRGRNGEGYTYLPNGQRLWGRYGAAGVLFRWKNEDDGQTYFYLQHRSADVQAGDTWSTPGGALDEKETPEQGAAREVEEELGFLPEGATVVGEFVHKPSRRRDWKYTTVVVDVPEPFWRDEDLDEDEFSWEAAGDGWFTLDELPDLPLHPGFETTLDQLDQFKAARHVRTPEGVRRFRKPLGALITGLPDLGPAAPYVGATDEAKAKVKSVQVLIDEGMDPAAAVKEHKRLVHNERVRLIRERQKAEAAGQAAVEVDQQSPPPKKLDLDAHPEVIADQALALQKGAQPKALYDAGEQNGPGAVAPGEWWFSKLKEDTTGDPIPVVGLTVEGHKVERGLAVMLDGRAFLVDVGPEETDHAALTRLHSARVVVDGVLSQVPDDKALYLRGVALVNGSNPKDAELTKGHIVATGGQGSFTVWNANAVPLSPATVAHEFGHNVDTQAWLANEWLSDADESVIPGQLEPWATAKEADAAYAKAVVDLGFVESRPSPAHPITPGESVSEYGKTNPHEDFAESVRLYLKDKREGKLGYLKGMTQAGKTGPDVDALPATFSYPRMAVRFSDVFPERARTLDAVLGLKTNFDTPYRAAQRKRVEDQAYEAAKNGTFLNLATSATGLPSLDAQLAVVVGEKRRADELALEAQTKAKTEALGKVQPKVDHALQTILEDYDADAGDALSDEELDVWSMSLLSEMLSAELSLSPDDVTPLVHAAKLKYQAHVNEKEAQAQKLVDQDAAEAAAADAADAQNSLLSIEDLPADDKKKIRKKKAAVKFYAKKGGASLEDAQKAADEYEVAAVAERLQELGLLAPGAVAAPTGKAAKPAVDHLRPGVKAGTLTKANKWVYAAGTYAVPHAGEYKYYGYDGGYGPPQQAKANIAAELADALDNPTDWALFSDYKVKTGEWAQPMAYTATDSTRRYELQKEVALRIAGWASTAGDSDTNALMMQHAVKDEFGLKADWGARLLAGGSFGDKDKVLQNVTTAYPKYAPFYRRFVRVMYEHTQAEFKKAGITEVGLHRGMHSHGKDWGQPGDHRVPLQPANSWTTSKATARSFAGYSSDSVILSATVPVARILGTARTGFGARNEREFVVMDSDGAVRVTKK